MLILIYISAVALIRNRPQNLIYALLAIRDRILWHEPAPSNKLKHHIWQLSGGSHAACALPIERFAMTHILKNRQQIIRKYMLSHRFVKYFRLSSWNEAAHKPTQNLFVLLKLIKYRCRFHLLLLLLRITQRSWNVVYARCVARISCTRVSTRRLCLVRRERWDEMSTTAAAKVKQFTPVSHSFHMIVVAVGEAFRFIFNTKIERDGSYACRMCHLDAIARGAFASAPHLIGSRFGSFE